MEPIKDELEQIYPSLPSVSKYPMLKLDLNNASEILVIGKRKSPVILNMKRSGRAAAKHRANCGIAHLSPEGKLDVMEASQVAQVRESCSTFHNS